MAAAGNRVAGASVVVVVVSGAGGGLTCRHFCSSRGSSASHESMQLEAIAAMLGWVQAPRSAEIILSPFGQQPLMLAHICVLYTSLHGPKAGEFAGVGTDFGAGAGAMSGASVVVVVPGVVVATQHSSLLQLPTCPQIIWSKSGLSAMPT